MKWFLNGWIIVFVLVLTGCKDIPLNYPKETSSAYKAYTSTSMGKIFAKKEMNHPGRSGFDIVSYGREAFTARIAMAQMAEKSLDLQYYLWEVDETGRLLVHYVLKAADRGVKVRILLDDMGLDSRDTMLASIDAHPNIEIRIFNPFSKRSSRGLNFLTDFDRVNHRMHNKTYIMDNTLLMVGGRNIGNHYFGVDSKVNFRDLDVVAAGPIVRDVSKVYDYFWNGKWSIPLKALVDKKYSYADMKNARATIAKKVSEDHYPYPLSEDIHSVQSQMKTISKNLVWAKGIYIWDDPKQMVLSENKQRGTMIQRLNTKSKTLKKSLTIETPYFVPREQGTAELKHLAQRGVKIRILTNSQSSNDVGAAFAGYEKYRKPLLQSDIALYELRADAGNNSIINKETKLGSVSSALHTKAMVFDEKRVFVGSFNLDPRSAAINTEGGLSIESTVLAKRVLAYMSEGVKPQNAYKLTLDSKGDIVWSTMT